MAAIQVLVESLGGSCLSVRALKGPQMTVRVCLNFEVNFCQRRVKTEASPSEVTRFRVSELLVAVGEVSILLLAVLQDLKSFRIFWCSPS